MVTISDTMFVFWIIYTFGLVFNMCTVVWYYVFEGDIINNASYHKKWLITVIMCMIYITPVISTGCSYSRFV